MDITFNAATNGGESTGTSKTYAHSCGGDNRILFVLTRGGAGDGDKISGITYGGVAMTQVDTATRPTENSVLGMWLLVNPASGANNVVISLSSSGFMGSCCSSYFETEQANQPDSSNTKTASSGTSFAISTTSVDDNSWAVTFVRGGNISAGASTTERVKVGSDTGIYDGNAPVTPAGSTTLNISGDESQWAGVIASFSPVPPVTSEDQDLNGFYLT